uniref:Uncharacterized protein n=1 Tax=Bracon brevicornis TaxID=1563983 RepID=A0A6V7JN86_9HYME
MTIFNKNFGHWTSHFLWIWTIALVSELATIDLEALWKKMSRRSKKDRRRRFHISIDVAFFLLTALLIFNDSFDWPYKKPDFEMLFKDAVFSLLIYAFAVTLFCIVGWALLIHLHGIRRIYRLPALLFTPINLIVLEVWWSLKSTTETNSWSLYYAIFIFFVAMSVTLSLRMYTGYVLVPKDIYRCTTNSNWANLKKTVERIQKKEADGKENETKNQLPPV